MRKRGVITVILGILVLFSASIVSGCGSSQNQAQSSANQNSPASKPIKIGVLPIEDNLPFYAAEKDDLFSKAGISVELVPFPSAVERDAALQANQIDGEIADLVAVALLKKGGTDVKVAAIGLGATPKEGRFAILSKPDSAIRKPAELKNVQIGVSENSIIDYVTDQMLHDNGLQDADIKKLSISKMPVRLDMLLSNQIPAACLPDPLAALAQAKGAHLVVDSTYREIAQTVLLFRNSSLQNNLAGIQALVKVYGEAGQALTNNPGQYRELLIEKAQVPAAIKDTFQMPTFSKLQLPTKDEVDNVMQWMVDKKLLSQPYSYEEIVDPGLLPKT